MGRARGQPGSTDQTGEWKLLLINFDSVCETHILNYKVFVNALQYTRTHVNKNPNVTIAISSS